MQKVTFLKFDGKSHFPLAANLVPLSLPPLTVQPLKQHGSLQSYFSSALVDSSPQLRFQGDNLVF